MDFSVILDWIATNGIWCALFVWLFYTSRTEASSRENRLMTVVEEQGEKLKTIAATLENINNRLDNVEEEIEDSKVD